MRAKDTTSAAHWVQVDAWRRLGGSETVAMAIGLSEQARCLTADGIRARHPDYTGFQVKHALFRLVFGDALCSEIWPRNDLLDP